MKNVKKYLSVLFLAAILMLSMCVTAFAAGNVTYDGSAKKFVFAPGSEYSLSDLFPELKGVMPGDQLTQQVLIKNTANKNIRIYMRALGAKEGSETFLSQINLTISGDKELFNAPADQTAQLTDWVYLGEFKPDSQVTLDVTLDVPIDLDNDFQNSIGYLEWEFKAEEVSDSGRITPSNTGDSVNIGLWVGIASACVLAIVIIIIFKRKKR